MAHCGASAQVPASLGRCMPHPQPLCSRRRARRQPTAARRPHQHVVRRGSWQEARRRCVTLWRRMHAHPQLAAVPLCCLWASQSTADPPTSSRTRNRPAGVPRQPTLSLSGLAQAGGTAPAAGAAREPTPKQQPQSQGACRPGGGLTCAHALGAASTTMPQPDRSQGCAHC
jgi:ferric-dicitrate binding protein FerR (iron transport regulator)